MADERSRKAGILNDFDVSIGRIRQLVQERETNSNSLMKTISDNISAIDGKINELRGVSDTVAETYNRIKRELEACNKTTIDQARRITELTRELDRINAEKQAIEEELNEINRSSLAFEKQNNERIQKLREEIESRQATIDLNEQFMQQMTNEIQPLKEAKARLEAELSKLNQLNEKKDAEIRGIIGERDNHIDELTREVQARIAQIQGMEKNIEGMQQHIEGMNRDIEVKDAQIAELTTRNSDNATRIQELERNLAEITALQQRKDQELAELKAENADLINRIMGATRAITEAMATLDDLRTSRRSENTSQLLEQFQRTTGLIQDISTSLQGLRGGKRFKKQKTRKIRKTRKTRKSKKMKKMKGGFIYGTSSSSKRKSPKKRSSSSSSSSSNNNNKYKKINKNKF